MQVFHSLLFDIGKEWGWIGLRSYYLKCEQILGIIHTIQSIPYIGDKVIPPLVTGILVMDISLYINHPYHRKPMGVWTPAHIKTQVLSHTYESMRQFSNEKTFQS